MPRRRPRNHRGRSTILNPDLEETILTNLRQGCAITHAAAAAGIRPGTYHDWIRRGEDAAALEQETGQPAPEREQPFVAFAERAARARAEGAVNAVKSIKRAAQGGFVVRETTRTYVNGEGAVVEEREVTRQPPDWRAAAWWLERAFRTEFGRNVEEDAGRAGESLPAGALQELAERLRSNMERAARELPAGDSSGPVLEGEVVSGD